MGGLLACTCITGMVDRNHRLRLPMPGVLWFFFIIAKHVFLMNILKAGRVSTSVVCIHMSVSSLVTFHLNVLAPCGACSFHHGIAVGGVCCLHHGVRHVVFTL